MMHGPINIRQGTLFSHTANKGIRS